MKMKILFCLILLLLGLTWAVKPKPECILRSRHPDGTPANCGGIVNQQCPNPTDTCKYLPGSSFGACCLGCKSGKPLPRNRCGGWSGKRCPRGYQCVYDPFIADLEGMCCRRTGSVRDYSGGGK